MPEPLTPTDARAILAWLDICESHRTFQCLRAGTDGGPEVAKFLADHPTGSASIAKLRALAADEGETVTERSCFTCAHDEDHEDDDGTLFELGHFCKIKIGRDDIFDYCVKSGAFDTHDGMPTDRSIPCPGWSAKVAP